jgi:hypothetical protein
MTNPALEVQPSSAASVPPSSAAAPSSAAVLTDSSAAASSSAAAPVAGAPESYDLKVPETAKGIDAAIVERTAAIARAQGLGNEAAQKLLEGVVAEVTAQQTAQVEAWKPGGSEWTKRDAEWRAAALADAAIGGSPEKLAKSVELAQKVMAKFGGDDVVAFLKETGLGSHPAALKLLSKIGAAMSESSLVVGAPAAVAGSLSAAEKMYGPDGTGKPKSE